MQSTNRRNRSHHVSGVAKRLRVMVVGIGALMLLSPALAKSADTESEIRALMDQQASDWNHGDLSAFMNGYLDSPDTSYFAGDCEVYGIEAIKERYQKRYGKDSSSMGTLTFSDLRIQSLGKHSALCLGHFHVVRKDKPDANGIFSLVLKRTGGKWKALHDHSTASSPSN